MLLLPFLSDLVSVVYVPPSSFIFHMNRCKSKWDIVLLFVGRRSLQLITVCLWFCLQTSLSTPQVPDPEWRRILWAGQVQLRARWPQKGGAHHHQLHHQHRQPPHQLQRPPVQLKLNPSGGADVCSVLPPHPGPRGPSTLLWWSHPLFSYIRPQTTHWLLTSTGDAAPLWDTGEDPDVPSRLLFNTVKRVTCFRCPCYRLTVTISTLSALW